MPQLTGRGKQQLHQLRTERAAAVLGCQHHPQWMHPIPAHTATRGTAAQTCSHKAQQSLDIVYPEKTGLVLPGDHWGCQELSQLSTDHFTGVTGKSYHRASVISAELIEIPILRFFSHKYFWQCSTSQIFSSLLMSRRYCSAAKHLQSRSKNSALNFSGENAAIQAPWGLPGFVSFPVGTLTRQWLKSASSYVWIIKCHFWNLRPGTSQSWGNCNQAFNRFHSSCFFFSLSHTRNYKNEGT